MVFFAFAFASSSSSSFLPLLPASTVKELSNASLEAALPRPSFATVSLGDLLGAEWRSPRARAIRPGVRLFPDDCADVFAGQSTREELRMRAVDELETVQELRVREQVKKDAVERKCLQIPGS